MLNPPFLHNFNIITIIFSHLKPHISHHLPTFSRGVFSASQVAQPAQPQRGVPVAQDTTRVGRTE